MNWWALSSLGLALLVLMNWLAFLADVSTLLKDQGFGEPIGDTFYLGDRLK